MKTVKLVPSKERGSDKLYLWTVVHKSKFKDKVIVQRVVGKRVEILNKNFKIETHLANGQYRSYFNTEKEADYFIKHLYYKERTS